MFDNSTLISGKIVESDDMWPEQFHDDAHVISFVGCSHKCVNCNSTSNLCNKSLIIQGFSTTRTSVLSYYPGAKLIPDFYKFDHTEKGLTLFIDFINSICTNNNRLIFSGGDPLFIDNLKFIKDYLLQKNKPRICIYTGYSIDDVKKMGVEGFEFIKCGRFEQDKELKRMKSDKLLQLSSTNQNFYNSNKKPISSNGIITF